MGTTRSGRCIYVSTRGDDRWSGTYRFSEPLKLAARDSGTPERPVTCRAFPGERPVLSGGRALTMKRHCVRGTRAGGRIWTPYFNWGICSDNTGMSIPRPDGARSLWTDEPITVTKRSPAGRS